MERDAGMEAFFDQIVAATREAHGPGHPQEWYEAVARRMIWYRTHDGNMSECPFDVPE